MKTCPAPQTLLWSISKTLLMHVFSFGTVRQVKLGLCVVGRRLNTMENSCVPLMVMVLERDSFVVFWLTDCNAVVKVASACAVVPQLFSVGTLCP